MSELEELQFELQKLKAEMDIDMESGLGCAAEDVHKAAEILNRIRSLRLKSADED